MRCVTRFIPVFALIACLAAPHAQAGATTPTLPLPPRPANAPFRIGYVHADPTDPLNDRWFRGLRADLKGDAKFMQALTRAGFSEVVVRGAEGYRDLIQRMENGEFDCVFCTSVVFARQAERYQTVMQIGSAKHRHSQGEGLIMRSCLVVGPQHALFNMDKKKISNARIKGYLETGTVAFVSRYSAAYVHFKLRMHRDYNAWPRNVYFCGSSEAVIKNVSSGLIDVGVCEELAIDSLTSKTFKMRHPPRLVRILDMTPLKIQGDPVVFRRSLVRPEATASPQYDALITAFERALRERLRLGRLRKDGPEDFDFVAPPAYDHFYDHLREELRNLDSLEGREPR